MKEKNVFNYAERWKLRFDSDYYHRRKRSKKTAIYITAGIALVILFALPWIWQYKLNSDLTKIQERIIAYNEVQIVLQELDELRTDIGKMEEFLRITEESSKNPRDTLEQLKGLLPEGTEIGAFSLQADYSIQVGMVLLGPPEVAELWVNLVNSGLYEEFDMQTVSLVDQPQSINLTLKLKR